MPLFPARCRQSQRGREGAKGPFTYDDYINMGFLDPLPLWSLSHSRNLSVLLSAFEPTSLPLQGKRHMCTAPKGIGGGGGSFIIDVPMEEEVVNFNLVSIDGVAPRPRLSGSGHPTIGAKLD